MADDRSVNFGSFLDRETSDRKVWLLVIPVLLLVIGGAIWAVSAVSRAEGYRTEADRAAAHGKDLEKAIDERDKLIVEARSDEGLLKSAGQATGVFYGVAPQATESGVAIANPAERAVRVYLYGLVAPPGGQEYVVAARGPGGAPRFLATVVPSEAGTAFVLAKDLPQGTSSIEVLFRATGAQGLDDATPRVAARYPASAGDRGMLMQPVQVQGRKGGGRSRR